jgi:hypothetical protein
MVAVVGSESSTAVETQPTPRASGAEELVAALRGAKQLRAHAGAAAQLTNARSGGGSLFSRSAAAHCFMLFGWLTFVFFDVFAMNMLLQPA